MELDVSPHNNTTSNFTDYNRTDDDFMDLSYFSRSLKLDAIIAIILCILAVIANVISLFAIVHVRGGLNTRYRLVISLAVSDILISLSVMLHYLNEAYNPRLYFRFRDPMITLTRDCAYVLIKAMNTTALNISLLNLMGMAIDHFLAILKPFHYHKLMNRKKGVIMIVILWSCAIICGFSDFLSGIVKYAKFRDRYNYCDFINQTVYHEEYTVFGIALLCFIMMTVIYLRIYLEVRSIQTRPEILAQQDVKKNTKAIVTTLLILGSFIICWLPQSLFEIAMFIQVQVNPKALQPVLQAYKVATKYIYCLLLLNCILDPVIYAIRMRDVQYGYRIVFKCKRQNSMDNSTSVTLLSRKFSRVSNGPDTHVNHNVLRHNSEFSVAGSKRK